ncbi:hypothetical protein V0R50_14330 [Pseudomonas sp. 148P]|uniref:Uncharacterized protein n=1 Tax=Pseudomonas ulcerans TaxID=3115852 RepID=A0ABU7HS89_9PSED|nr:MULTISPECIES: hypothetical protein [unclassified Pseudomonas]MEE1923434.1 hypothetical protein [Pseudomonas sp. 147P]MEE1934406.1 hypothetical protein [Pseudomonas sp. 148P]
MSLTMAIFMLIAAWLSVAAAMLWGVLRIARRHHLHHQDPHPQAKPLGPVHRRAPRRPASAH